MTPDPYLRALMDSTKVMSGRLEQQMILQSIFFVCLALGVLLIGMGVLWAAIAFRKWVDHKTVQLSPSFSQSVPSVTSARDLLAENEARYRPIAYDKKEK